MKKNESLEKSEVWTVPEITVPNTIIISLDDAQIKSILASFIQQKTQKEVKEVGLNWDKYEEGMEAKITVSI